MRPVQEPLPPGRSSTAQRRRGFTTIELMIALAILTILFSVALPTFLDQVRKGRRSDAITALGQLQQAQERWRSTNTAYASPTQLTSNPGLNLPGTSPRGYYQITINASDAVGYQATATAVSGTTQADDTSCSTMAVRMQQGAVSYGSGAGPDWSDSNRCWAK